MIRIFLDHNKMNESDLNTRLSYVFKKMNKNALYSMFQTLIALLGTISTTYDAALLDAEDGSDETRDIKNKLKVEAKVFLTKFIKKIEVVANDMPTYEEGFAFAKGTGCTVQDPTSSTTKKPLAFLEVPTDFNVDNDKQRKGVCLGTWNKVKSAVIYILEELDEDGNIKNIWTCTQTFFLIEGTESKVKRNFRLRASAGILISDYTEVVSVWVR